MWVILFILTCILGYLTIAYWKQDFTWIEKLFLGFTLGMGEVSVMMFFMGLLQIPLIAKNILIIILFLNFIMLFVSKNRKITRGNKKNDRIPLNLTIFILVSLILSLIFWSFSQTIIFPPWEWDTLALYDFRGKLFALTQSLATGYLISQPTLTAYNYVYPFSTSLMHTLFYIGGGNNPQFIYTLFYCSLIFLLYGCVRRRLDLIPSLVLTLFLASTPEILSPSVIAYPNIPYALFFGFSTIYFWEYMEFKKSGYLFVSALLLGLSVWIRNTEPYWVVNVLFVLMYLIKEKRFRNLIVYFLIFFTLRQIWPIYQGYIFSHAPGITFNPPDPFTLDLRKIPQVLLFVLNYFIKDWLLYLLVLFSSLFFFWKAIFKYWLILLWLSSYLLLSIAGTFFFAVSFPWWNQVGGSAERVSVFFAPLILYAISILWADQLHDFKNYFTNFSIGIRFGERIRKIISWKYKK
jgi:hypothetical protein